MMNLFFNMHTNGREARLAAEAKASEETARMVAKIAEMEKMMHEAATKAEEEKTKRLAQVLCIALCSKYYCVCVCVWMS